MPHVSVSKNRSHQNAAAEAAEWLIDLQSSEVSRQQQEAAADWLRRSPVHVEEFLQLTALYGDLSRLTELKDFDVETALAQLRLSPVEDNIIALSPPAVSGAGRRDLSSGRRLVKTIVRFRALAAAVALIAVGLWSAWPLQEFLNRGHYRTQVGEQRSLTLVDGSQIQLNAVSSLTASVDKSIRELRLDEGEALFRVAKDPTHPFRVHTPQATIEAKGTQFNVHVSSGTTVVALLEGQVLVTPSSSAEQGVLLHPGEEVAVGERLVARPTPHKVDLKTAVAWTEHRLVFEDAPLAEVITEFNRYSRQPFVIEDPALRDVRITASFNSNSAPTFAESLAAAGTLRVTRQPSGSWLIERK